MPERIQLRRSAGWRKPEGVITVARPSKWGNPWRVDPTGRREGRTAPSRAEAVAAFRHMVDSGEWVPGYPSVDEIRDELAGHDLACWCPLEDKHGGRGPCHADILIEIANS